MRLYSLFKKRTLWLLLFSVVFLWSEWVPFGTERAPKKTIIDPISVNDNSVQLNESIFVYF